MANRKINSRIVKMIRTRQSKGHNARQIAETVNNSATAKQLGVEYSHRSVAAIMANLTMGKYQ